MTQRTLPWVDAQPLYVALKQLEQAVQGEDVPEFERLAVMGDIARRAVNALAAFEIKYPELVHMDEKASQEAVLLDLGSGYTLQCGYDEIAEMAFICGTDSGGRILPGCYWDYQELKEDGDSAPARVLGALALAGVPLLSAEVVRHAVLAFLQSPPQSGIDQENEEVPKRVVQFQQQLEDILLQGRESILRDHFSSLAERKGRKRVAQALYRYHKQTASSAPIGWPKMVLEAGLELVDWEHLAERLYPELKGEGEGE